MGLLQCMQTKAEEEGQDKEERMDVEVQMKGTIAFQNEQIK